MLSFIPLLIHMDIGLFARYSVSTTTMIASLREELRNRFDIYQKELVNSKSHYVSNSALLSSSN